MKEVSEEYTEIRVTVYVDTSILLKENYCCIDAKTTNIRDNVAIKDDFIQHSAVNNNQILQQLKQKTKLPLDNNVFSSADKAVNLSKNATRGGCDVTQESTKDRCDVTQGSTKSECDVTQESTKRRCDVTQVATKSGCDLIQGYTENRCDVTEESTKSGCDVRQGSTISGGNVAHRHYVENDRNIFTLLTKHKDHTTMRRYINTGKVKTEPETYRDSYKRTERNRKHRDSYKRTDLKSAVATGKTASPTQQVTLKQPVTNNHFKEKIREVTSDYEGSTSGLSSEDEDCKEEAPDSIKYDQVIYSSVKCGPHVNHPQTISKDTYASNNKTKTDLTKEKIKQDSKMSFSIDQHKKRPTIHSSFINHHVNCKRNTDPFFEKTKNTTMPLMKVHTKHSDNPLHRDSDKSVNMNGIFSKNKGEPKTGKVDKIPTKTSHKLSNSCNHVKQYIGEKRPDAQLKEQLSFNEHRRQLAISPPNSDLSNVSERTTNTSTATNRMDSYNTQNKNYHSDKMDPVSVSLSVIESKILSETDKRTTSGIYLNKKDVKMETETFCNELCHKEDSLDSKVCTKINTLVDKIIDNRLANKTGCSKNKDNELRMLEPCNIAHSNNVTGIQYDNVSKGSDNHLPAKVELEKTGIELQATSDIKSTPSVSINMQESKSENEKETHLMDSTVETNNSQLSDLVLSEMEVSFDSSVDKSSPSKCDSLKSSIITLNNQDSEATNETKKQQLMDMDLSDSQDYEPSDMIFSDVDLSFNSSINEQSPSKCDSLNVSTITSAEPSTEYDGVVKCDSLKKQILDVVKSIANVTKELHNVKQSVSNQNESSYSKSKSDNNMGKQQLISEEKMNSNCLDISDNVDKLIFGDHKISSECTDTSKSQKKMKVYCNGKSSDDKTRTTPYDIEQKRKLKISTFMEEIVNSKQMNRARKPSQPKGQTKTSEKTCAIQNKEDSCRHDMKYDNKMYRTDVSNESKRKKFDKALSCSKVDEYHKAISVRDSCRKYYETSKSTNYESKSQNWDTKDYYRKYSTNYSAKQENSRHRNYDGPTRLSRDKIIDRRKTEVQLLINETSAISEKRCFSSKENVGTYRKCMEKTESRKHIEDISFLEYMDTKSQLKSQKYPESDMNEVNTTGHSETYAYTIDKYSSTTKTASNCETQQRSNAESNLETCCKTKMLERSLHTFPNSKSSMNSFGLELVEKSLLPVKEKSDLTEASVHNDVADSNRKEENDSKACFTLPPSEKRIDKCIGMEDVCPENSLSNCTIQSKSNVIDRSEEIVQFLSEEKRISIDKQKTKQDSIQMADDKNREHNKRANHLNVSSRAFTKDLKHCSNDFIGHTEKNLTENSVAHKSANTHNIFNMFNRNKELLQTAHKPILETPIINKKRPLLETPSFDELATPSKKTLLEMPQTTTSLSVSDHHLLNSGCSAEICTPPTLSLNSNVIVSGTKPTNQRTETENVSNGNVNIDGKDFKSLHDSKRLAVVKRKIELMDSPCTLKKETKFKHTVVSFKSIKSGTNRQRRNIIMDKKRVHPQIFSRTSKYASDKTRQIKSNYASFEANVWRHQDDILTRDESSCCKNQQNKSCEQETPGRNIPSLLSVVTRPVATAPPIEAIAERREGHEKCFNAVKNDAYGCLRRFYDKNRHIHRISADTFRYQLKQQLKKNFDRYLYDVNDPIYSNMGPQPRFVSEDSMIRSITETMRKPHISANQERHFREFDEIIGYVGYNIPCYWCEVDLRYGQFFRAFPVLDPIGYRNDTMYCQ